MSWKKTGSGKTDVSYRADGHLVIKNYGFANVVQP